MTLVLALECFEGLVLASDSQATIGTSGQPVKGSTDKLYSTWSNVVWGASSNQAGIVQAVDEALAKKFSASYFENKSLATIKSEIAGQVALTVRDLANNRFINVPGTGFPPTSFVFCGYSPHGGSFIMEVAPNLLDEEHITRGYTAVGSGDIFPYFALASVDHYSVRDKSLTHAKMVAYRIVDDAIRVAANGLGPPVQMVEVRKPIEAGQFANSHMLTKDELDVVRDQVMSWKTVEAETLVDFVKQSVVSDTQTTDEAATGTAVAE